MRLGYEYLAGFLDFDGTVVVVSAGNGYDGRRRYYGKICFYSQNLQVLHDAQETVGGTIPPPAVDCYMLQLSIRETVEALRNLVPYLRIKREQALLVLKLHEMIDATPAPPARRYGKGGSERLPEEVWAARKAIYLKMRELNHADSQALRKNRNKSVKPSGREATPSQAETGQRALLGAVGVSEGVTTRGVSPSNNLLHETPARKGRHSLSSADPTVLH